MHVVQVSCVTPPTIEWRCPRCPSTEFVCSERFRMNTHRKLADIWLVYRCACCDSTKNVTIIERTPVTKIAPDLFAAAESNDPLIARRFARDVSVLRRAGTRVARGDEFALAPVPPDACDIRLLFDEPLLVRVEDVVAAATSLSRAQVRSLHGAGGLAFDADRPGSKLRLVSQLDVRRAG